MLPHGTALKSACFSYHIYIHVFLVWARSSAIPIFIQYWLPPETQAWNQTNDQCNQRNLPVRELLLKNDNERIGNAMSSKPYWFAGIHACTEYPRAVSTVSHCWGDHASSSSVDTFW